MLFPLSYEGGVCAVYCANWLLEPIQRDGQAIGAPGLPRLGAVGGTRDEAGQRPPGWWKLR